MLHNVQFVIATECIVFVQQHNILRLEHSMPSVVYDIPYIHKFSKKPYLRTKWFVNSVLLEVFVVESMQCKLFCCVDIKCSFVT